MSGEKPWGNQQGSARFPGAMSPVNSPQGTTALFGTRTNCAILILSNSFSEHMVKPTSKDLDAVLHVSKSSIVLNLEVSPASKRPGFTSINPWRKTLCLSVKAPPKKGEANKEVLKAVADLFKVSIKNVTIVHGETSSMKRIQIENLNLDNAKQALQRVLNEGDC
jgi:uncharacterized protein